jgi:hypothetical protein|tara:strand:+ start:1553 stop:1963 length:411 start_codon:yes stop_codon:yes gene_type:complete
MAKQVIAVGSAPNDGTGDPLRDSMVKVNSNFTEVYDDLETKQSFTGLLLDSETAATSGNVTINKPMGKCNVVTGTTSVTITNNLVTADSCVFGTILNQDATSVRNIVPTAGAFTIYLGAGTAGAVVICFVVINSTP